MKLIIAVVQKRDADVALGALTGEGYFVTHVASTGGFLREGNVTLLMGVDDERVDGALAVLGKNCHRRRHFMPMPLTGAESGFGLHGHIEVEVGGATVFVFDVEQFEQI
jgi:uncharacterized protein YaaQ